MHQFFFEVSAFRESSCWDHRLPCTLLLASLPSFNTAYIYTLRAGRAHRWWDRFRTVQLCRKTILWKVRNLPTLKLLLILSRHMKRGRTPYLLETKGMSGRLYKYFGYTEQFFFNLQMVLAIVLILVFLHLSVLDYSPESYTHPRLSWSSGGLTTWWRKSWETQFNHQSEGDIMFKYLVITTNKHSLPRTKSE